MEVQEQSPGIAVINTNINFIQRDIADMKVSLKELNSVFATKEQLRETATIVEERLARLEKQSNLWRWVSPTLSFSLGSGITFLVIQYLMHLK